MGEPKVLKVFYAWQSDLPDATNRRAIRKAEDNRGVVSCGILLRRSK
jgi:hypothetical protein